MDITTEVSLNDQPLFPRQQPLEENSIINEEYLYILVNFVAVFVDCLIVSIILRFKGLQTKLRMFVMNWAATDLLFLIFNSSMYRLYSQIHEKMEIYEFFCMFSQIEYLLLAAKAAFVLMLHSDFAFERFTLTSFKYTVIGCWAVLGILAFISGSYCFRQIYNGFPVLIYLITFSMLFATCFFKVINFLRSRKQGRDMKVSLRFALTSIYVLCWSLSWFCLVLDVCLELSGNSDLFLVAIAVGNALGYGNAIVNFVLLANMDQAFKKGTVHVFRCSKSRQATNQVPTEEDDCLRIDSN